MLSSQRSLPLRDAKLSLTHCLEYFLTAQLDRFKTMIRALTFHCHLIPKVQNPKGRRTGDSTIPQGVKEEEKSGKNAIEELG